MLPSYPQGVKSPNYINKLITNNKIMQKRCILQKLCGVLSFIVLLHLHLAAFAAGAGDDAKITLKLRDVSLEKAISCIKEQSPYLFFISSVDLSKTVSVDVQDEGIENVCKALFVPAGVRYKIEGHHVYLSPAVNHGGPAVLSGSVSDASGAAVPGVSVFVAGTTTGTTTDLDGKFSLEVDAEHLDGKLEFNSLGYETILAAIGDRRIFNVILREATTELEGTVVTALGIRRSEKALNYNVQKVSGADLTSVKDVNFVNSLNGKIAGVTINASSSGIGGESKVVMRGTKGITSSSNALYVIDGVPMYPMSDNGATDYGSRGRSEGIADINPEDIESMSVLTGAAAAALYGSNASNGAIVITTKKGREGKAELSVTSNTEVLTPMVLPRFQDRYGNVEGEATSWGGVNNGKNGTGYNPATDFLRAGVVATETVSLSVGNGKNQIYASVGAVDSKGIVPNNGYHRYNASIRNTTSFLKDRIHLDVAAQYIKQKDLNMVNQGIYGNPLVAAWLFPRGEDWRYAKMFETYSPERKIYTQNWDFMGKGGIEWDNPYWTQYRILRRNDRDRYMISGGLTWDILDWLKLSGRVRIDNTDNTFSDNTYAGTNPTITEGSSNGYMNQEESAQRQIYADVLLSMNKTWGDWSIGANLSASVSDMKSRLMQIRGGIREDGLPNVFAIQQLDKNTQIPLQSGWQEQTQSLLGSVEVGYKGTYYLTATGRNDWPSQLSGPHSNRKSFFYPSVGGSVVLSQIIPMPEQIDFLKIRGSWASVGLPFARFIANPTYSWNNKTGAWETSKAYPMYDLRPERTDSWEVGLTFKAFKGLSLDVSYYDTKTYNQTFDSQLSVSSGYTTLYVQTGSVRNRGVELSAGYEHRWGIFGWSSNYTLSVNRNKVETLMENYHHPETGKVISLSQLKVGGFHNAAFVLTPGGTLGDLYTTVDLNRDVNGNIYIDESGKISRTTTDYKKLGSVFPKANMAWNNDFDIKGFNFGFMVSARIGGIVYSATQARMDSFGVSETTAAARDNGGVNVDGCMMDAHEWYSVAGADDGIPQYYTYDATNIRLQEAHVGYTIPRKVLGNICDLNISVVGRNLWMIYCKAPFDPECVATAGNYYQGIDNFMMPSTRSVALSLRLKF